MICPLCHLPRVAAGYCAACEHPAEAHTIDHYVPDQTFGCTHAGCKCPTYTEHGCRHGSTQESP